MPSFGRRGTVPNPIATAPASDAERPRYGSAWGVLKLAVLFGFSLILLGFRLQDDARSRALDDHTPDARYDIGPARGDPACPLRRWAVGDYLPDSCFKGQVLNDVTPIGLENTAHGRRDIRSFYWVRASSDVMLVDCPFVSTSCRVWKVARNRLAGASAPTDHADHARPTLSYLLGTAFCVFNALMLPLIGIIGIAAWLYIEAGRRRRAGDLI